MIPQVESSTDIGIYNPHNQQLQDNPLTSRIDGPFPKVATTVILTAFEPDSNDKNPEALFFSNSPLTDISDDTSPIPELPENMEDTAPTGNPPHSNTMPTSIHLFSLDSMSHAIRNVNGKRPFPEERPSDTSRVGKRTRSNLPRTPRSTWDMPVHIPMHISINNGFQTGMPIDSNYFSAAIASRTHFAPLLLNHTPATQAPAEDPQPSNDENHQQSLSDSLTAEIQGARCNTSRYKDNQFPRCVSCVRKVGGDTCRFQGIRIFLRDNQNQIVGVTFVDYQQAESARLQFPQEWNVPLTSASIRRVKLSVASALWPLLKKEQEHMQLPNIVRRPRETDARITCDTCLTSIFSCAWMCRICGREACAECIKHIKNLTFPERAMNLDGTKKMHANPHFLHCVKRPEHCFEDFSPVTRFCAEELEVEINAMQQLLSEYVAAEEMDFGPSINGVRDDMPASVAMDTTSRHTMLRQLTSNGDGLDRAPHSPSLRVTRSPPIADAVPGRSGDPVDPAEVPPALYRIFEDKITDDQFKMVWAKGEPLVVTNLLQNFSIKWDPEHFIENYGEEKCLVLECHTNESTNLSVGQFFSQFGKQGERKDRCWKLKDWPPSSDFKQTFPDLYEDFIKAVPVPNYTRRDGSMNIAAHFPDGDSVPPDLGPKMYNAFSSSEEPGKKGTTRLHMDMADAVNIMLYSTLSPNGGEGVAAWDIYKADDAPKIRKFLKEHYKDEYSTGSLKNDPIHSQIFYLDIDLRKKLYENYGVSAWRIYQRPGDAVFIPAGCAHQVVNLADCIKVACDFVSPENVERCSELTREFREQNQMRTWKEDVLQLSGMMWFCWLNLKKIEEEMVQ